MITRRSLLLSAGALAPATAMASGGTGIPQTMLYLMNGAIGIHPAQGAVLFPAEQAALGSNFDLNSEPKFDGLIHIGGNEVIGYTQPGSIFANLLLALRADEMPINQMRVWTGHDDTGFENLTVDILPPNKTITVYDPGTGQPRQVSFGNPAVQLHTANASGKQTFVSMIPRYWLGSWQFLHLFLNSTVHNNQVSNWIFKHFIKNYPDPQNETPPVFSAFNPDGAPSSPAAKPLFLPWGITGSFGNPVLNFTLGAIPGQGTGGLQNVAIDSVIFDPNFSATPSYVQSQLVNSNGTFNRPKIGAPNLISPYIAPVHLTGGWASNMLVGFGYNSGFQEVNNGIDTLTIDTSFNRPAWSDSIESAEGFGSPFD